MTDALPSAAQEAARLRIKQREDGIRAQAIKEGYAKARRELEAQMENQAAALKGQLDGAEAAYRVAAATAHKAGHAHGFWRGATLGGVIVGAITLAGAAWFANAVIGPTFDAASEARVQQQAVDAFVAGQREQPAPEYGRQEP